MKIEGFKRYNRSYLVVEANGQVTFDGVLKQDESVKIVNKKQLKSIKNKSKNISGMTDFIKSNEGRFIHLVYRYGYPLMDALEGKIEGNKNNIHIIRFMKLATYLTFGGKLFDENKNEIKKSSLSKIWDTKSRNSINETYNILIECGYIYESEEGNIMINNDIAIKGAVEDFKKLKKVDNNLTYVRVFTDNLNAMYECTEAKQRKQLANLYKVIPFINFKHNVFCSNPSEVDKGKLNLLSWTDLANLCGYDSAKQLSRFKKDLFNLEIFGYDVIGEFKSKKGYYIAVNPKVYYGGDNVDDVEFLYKSFEMVNNCDKNKSNN